MMDRYFLKMKRVYRFRSLVLVLVVSMFLFRFPVVGVRADTTAQSIPTATSTVQLLNESAFTTDDLSTVLVQPQFTDGSTNIAFYLDIDGTYVWQAEQLGSLGVLPFVDYWDVSGNSDGGIGNYVAVEYLNSGQQFSCSGLSLDDCVADPHFISQFGFQIVNDDAATDLSTIVAESTIETANATTTLDDATGVADVLASSTASSDDTSATSTIDDTLSSASTTVDATTVATSSADDTSTTTIDDDTASSSTTVATSSADDTSTTTIDDDTASSSTTVATSSADDTSDTTTVSSSSADDTESVSQDLTASAATSTTQDDSDDDAATTTGTAATTTGQ
jgi:hypothetical protein